jgi:polyhydroxybutyrate depolymerase
MRMSGILLALAVAAITCVGTARGSQKVTDVEPTIHIDGFDRTYLAHRPAGFNSSKALPVVMMLHGRGGSSHLAGYDFGWIEKSDKEGFIIVFPQALPIDPARPSGSPLPENFIRGWSTPTNDTLWWTRELATNYQYVANPDYPRVVHPLDAPFLTAVLHDVLRRFRGDSQHVYIAGFSSGGEMASDFAQFASEEITAAAIVGSVGLSRPHQLTHPLSLFLAIGTDDSSGQPSQTAWNSMPGIAKEKWYGQESLPTLEQDVAVWARLNGCKRSDTTATLWGQQTDWSGCDKDARVRGLSVDHLGHEWPGSKPSRWNQTNSKKPLYLTDVLWRFFRSEN